MEDNRRSFVKHAGVLAAGSLLPYARAKGANDRVVLALIGGRNQGRGDATRAIQQGAEIKTFCDLDEAVLHKVGAELEKAQGKAIVPVKDFRRVLDDKDIDGVIIATPDHWHTHMALWGCQAGKDLYLEKPVSQTIHEGQLIRDAARKYNRIVQVGTQWRSSEYGKSAIEYLATGRLGKICLVKAWHSQVRESIGKTAGRISAGRHRLRCAAWPGSGQTVQSKPVPLQLALLLGLRQQRDREPGHTRARSGDVGHPVDARHR
jgi:hypothetical protein